MDVAEYDSRNRLHHLRQLRESHLAVTRDLGREIADLRAVVASAQTRLRQLDTQPSDLGFYGKAEIAAEADRLAKKIDEVEIELAELSSRHANANDAWNSAARLLTRCLDFAREKNLPVPSALKDEGIAVRSVAR